MSSQVRKIKQDELRRLMSEQKKKLISNVKKIESPLARYDKDGTLNCIICQTVVRSEAVWNVHLNSKKHKDNLANRLKKKVEAPSEPVQSNAAFKRPRPPTPPLATESAKKVRSILKNAPTSPKHGVDDDEMEADSVTEDDAGKREAPVVRSVNVEASSESENEPEEAANKDVLPEGFFDDPKLDAKVRNVEYKDPIEEEWEQFQKEIREETSKAQQIIAEDQEEATTERQIDEIDEQIRNWTRVVSLEKKKQEVIKTPVAPAGVKREEDSSGEENEFEEFLDWRSKKSFD